MQNNITTKLIKKTNDTITRRKSKGISIEILRINNNTKEWFNLHIAKQCALIAVDEILNINSVDKDFSLSHYWLDVKDEIVNL
jgi:hypothetical protein